MKLFGAISLGLSLASALFSRAQSSCERLNPYERNVIEHVFIEASGIPDPRNDVVWGPRRQFDQPKDASACLWSVLEQCETLGKRSYQCGNRRLVRLEVPLQQLQAIQSQCEFASDAQTVYSHSRSPEVRARICLASVMKGGDPGCLESERKIFNADFTAGFDEKDRQSDPWLFQVLEMPNPAYSRLQSWLQTLPAKSRNRHMAWARRLAIASHTKKYPEFLAMFRETDAFFSNYLVKWAVYYFPQADWHADFAKLRWSAKKQADLLGMIQFEREHQHGAAEAKRAQAEFCAPPPKL